MQEGLRERQEPQPASGGTPPEADGLDIARDRAEQLHREAMDAIGRVLSDDSQQFNRANTQPTGQ